MTVQFKLRPLTLLTASQTIDQLLVVPLGVHAERSVKSVIREFPVCATTERARELL